MTTGQLRYIIFTYIYDIMPVIQMKEHQTIFFYLAMLITGVIHIFA